MLTCRECGAELHEDQKVCIQCGKRTIRGDGYDWDQKSFRPTRNMYIGAGAVVLVLLIIILINALKVIPPDQVSQTWFEAMTQRDSKMGAKLVTKEFVDKLGERQLTVRDLADEYNGEVAAYDGKFRISSCVMKGNNAATTIVLIEYPDGRKGGHVIELVKQGRRWLVNSVQ